MNKIEPEIGNLNEKDFRKVIIAHLNGISSAVTKIDRHLSEFKDETLRHLKTEIYNTIKNNEEKLTHRTEKLELDYQTFKAKVVGGVLALGALVEIVKKVLPL